MTDPKWLEALEDAKKLVGAPPYNDSLNPCYNDGHFSAHCERTYGDSLWSRAIASANKEKAGDSFDVVTRARHYNSHASGVEAILIVRWLPFNHGNAFKYVFRRDGKEPVRSLRSAEYYLLDAVHQGDCNLPGRCWNRSRRSTIW